MITLTIPDDKLQESFEKHLNELLEKGNYNNPVKSILDNLLGYSGSLKGKLGKQIEDLFEELMATESFKEMIGVALANEIAKRQVDMMQDKFKK